jgi:hypothetical protein
MAVVKAARSQADENFKGSKCRQTAVLVRDGYQDGAVLLHRYPPNSSDSVCMILV